MKSLLLLTSDGGFTEAVRSVLDPPTHKLIVHEASSAAEAFLDRGAIDGVLLDVDQLDALAIRAIQELKAAAPNCPLLVFANTKPKEWEDHALIVGASYVLAKPLQAPLLCTLLERLLKKALPERQALPCLPSQAPTASAGASPVCTLSALRDFSSVLTHTLDADALLNRFLLLLRQILGVNRAVIFLRSPSWIRSESVRGGEDRWLRSACAIGIEPTFLNHFALSRSAGIGGYLRQQGRILKASSPESLANREILKEFQLLGAQVAIPILDRESLVGVVVLDERLTGEPYTNEELSLVFHLLEGVGLAVRNSWLHDELEANNSMMSRILGQLRSGCVVVGESLSILHVNEAARRLFAAERGHFEFSHLPQELGSRLFQVLNSGEAFTPFPLTLPTARGRHFQGVITPFPAELSPHRNAVLLVIEDITDGQRAKQLEVEASTLRLITSMAQHLAHEIGNSVVPLSTHQQLIPERITDPEFQESLSAALGDGVKRISRLAQQMAFLAGSPPDLSAKLNVVELLQEAFQEARRHFACVGEPPLYIEGELDCELAGDRKALRHALGEVLLNALQAAPEKPATEARLSRDSVTLRIEIRDRGAGFSPESASRGTEAFFSTRAVGLGLGLTVCRRVMENHGGRIEIVSSPPSGGGLVRIELPVPRDV